MMGTLYVIGIGPGDPELITVKAVRILKKVPVLCFPKGREEGSSLALSVVKKVLTLDDKEIIEAYFPMRKRLRSSARPVPKRRDEAREQGQGEAGESGVRSCELDTRWYETVENILSRLNKGIDIAFITLGDPTIYSTFFYLYDRILELSPELNIEIVPGVSSINASASRAKISLGLADEKIAVIPATYTPQGFLTSVFENFDTVVLMKVHRVFDKVLKTLTEMNLVKNAVYISMAGMDEEIIIRDIRAVKADDLNYFSILIVRKQGRDDRG